MEHPCEVRRHVLNQLARTVLAEDFTAPGNCRRVCKLAERAENLKPKHISCASRIGHHCQSLANIPVPKPIQKP